jgi:hypothetical protein
VIGIPEPVMSIPKVGVDPISPTLMVGIIGIDERELLEHPKLGLNQVQPRGLGGRPRRMDMQLLEQSEEPGMVVDVVQVVEHDVQGSSAGSIYAVGGTRH